MFGVFLNVSMPKGLWERVAARCAGVGRRWRARILLLVAGCFGALPIACAPVAAKPTAGVVRQVDHILIASSEAKALFSLLSETFQFPVAWPMTDYGNFASGGVAVGNVNLEIVKDTGTAGAAGRVKSRWAGFALEPEPLRTSVPELDARGIRHGTPAPFKSGLFTTRWTTVGLPEVSGDASEVFLCEFAEDLTPRRRLLREQLQARGGGPLAVQSVREIVCGAREVEGMRARWAKLLNPVPASEPGFWSIGAGPGIRVIESKSEGIRGLVIQVKSVEPARRYLQERGLLGGGQTNSITLGGPLLEGLGIRLVK